MKKNILSLCALLIFFISIFGCKPTDYEIVTPEKFTGILKLEKSNKQNVDQVIVDFIDNTKQENIKIESTVTDSVLKSKLLYKDGGDWVTINSFEIDLKNGHYKRSMPLKVIENAEILKRKFNLQFVSKISDLMDAIPQPLYDKLGKAEFYKENTQAMFYHLAAINTVRRALISRTEDCECDINISYISRGTPFTCLQDKYVDANEVMKTLAGLSEAKVINGKQFKPVKTIQYLKENFDQLIPYSKARTLISAEMYEFWDTSFSASEKEKLTANFKAHQAKLANGANISQVSLAAEGETCEEETIGELSRGSSYSTMAAPGICILMGVYWGNQCGCCGNYNFACVCCHPLCMAHDRYCINCDQWGCGSACVPGCP